jgi:hypothetical protein
MPTIYEPDILEEFADRLYRQAGELKSQYILGGVFGGILFGALIGPGVVFAQALIESAKANPGDVFPMAVVGAFICAVPGGIAGFYSAREKIFELKFKAQQTLCQLQIEKNTRRADTVTQGLEPVTI